jgi:glycosyltransferase involved in cell wall biosynthesis
MLKKYNVFIGLKTADYLINESKGARFIISWTLFIVGIFLFLSRRILASFYVFSKVHSSAFSSVNSALSERWLRNLLQDRTSSTSRFSKLCDQFIDKYCDSESMRVWKENPRKIIGTRVLVVKSSAPDEKGVIILDYSYVFPIFMKCYDVEKIADKYHIVFEPSWTGFYNLEILSYARLKTPVFVEVSEPRDAVFIDSLKTNLISVPVAANWWIDHRIVKPDKSIAKERDIIMVASWARFKRHWSFFECLLKMRHQGVKMKVTLVGYPMDYTMRELQDMASRAGVVDQIEFFEKLTPEEVNKHLNRSKVFVLWSRREGFNRAIVEALLADIPVILRSGHNYGYEYPYINEKTGAYANEQNFEEIVRKVLSRIDDYSPRQWVMEHMTCQHAASILQDKIRRTAENCGENWTDGIVVKATELNSQKYWNESDNDRFKIDYDYIKSCALVG